MPDEGKRSWTCRIFGCLWSEWHPVGHIEGAEHRWCLRGCTEGQMRYR